MAPPPFRHPGRAPGGAGMRGKPFPGRRSGTHGRRWSGNRIRPEPPPTSLRAATSPRGGGGARPPFPVVNFRDLRQTRSVPVTMRNWGEPTDTPMQHAPDSRVERVARLLPGSGQSVLHHQIRGEDARLSLTDEMAISDVAFRASALYYSRNSLHLPCLLGFPSPTSRRTAVPSRPMASQAQAARSRSA